MLDALSTAVVELDGQGRVRAMNASAEQCLAIGRERARGNRFNDIEGVPDTLVQAISTSSDDRRGLHVRECELAGGLFDCTIQFLPEDRLLLEFYDLKWQIQQARLQQREVQTGMMDLLRRNLTHEIRNPLGGIRGAAQMMAAELDDHELGTLAKLIMREVDRVDELLARFGQPELSREAVDLHFIVQEAAQLLEMEAADRVRIMPDYDPSIPAISADISALRQLLINLLRNAYQAGASEIRIRSRIDHDSAMLQPGVRSVVRLDIEDNGCGVPESLRSLLFLPLVTGRRDGTGLGLALAQQVAAAHDGLLSYAPLDPGSRFTLKLPMGRAND